MKRMLSHLSDYENVVTQLSDHEKDVNTVIKSWKGCYHSYQIMKRMLTQLTNHEKDVITVMIMKSCNTVIKSWKEC